jgi:hypothetical protein
MHDRRSLSCTQNCEGPIPMHEGEAFRDLVRINHRFDSSGFNLACEALLLGMWNVLDMY